MEQACCQLFLKKKSLLIYDAAKSHLTDEVKREVKKYSKLAVIPGGLTKLLQPLDLSVNKSFKDKMKMKSKNWMREGKHEFTKSNKMKRASYSEVCNWIVECWNKISEYVIKNGFKKAKICYEDEMGNHYDSDIDIEECDEI